MQQNSVRVIERAGNRRSTAARIDQLETAPRTAHLIARATATRVARHLTAAFDTVATSNRLKSRLVITDDRDAQVAAAQADVDLVVFDGHGYLTEARIGLLPVAALRTTAGGLTTPGIALGCCWGATKPFVDALKSCLDAPTTLLACTGETKFGEAEPLFTALLSELADCASGPVTPARMQELMDHALTAVTTTHPGFDWRTRWLVEPLYPTARRSR